MQVVSETSTAGRRRDESEGLAESKRRADARRDRRDERQAVMVLVGAFLGWVVLAVALMVAVAIWIFG